jgi:hypothetical protein
VSLTGSRLAGLLLAWLGLGFVADAALAPVTHRVQVEAGLDPGAAPSMALRAGLVGVGALLVLAGLALAARDPGAGAEGEGGAPADDVPKRCYRCQEPWPRGADACPSCGAERLR